MKTEFELQCSEFLANKPREPKITIMRTAKDRQPYLLVSSFNGASYVQFAFMEKDLERFAVNILKALKSKKPQVND